MGLLDSFSFLDDVRRMDARQVGTAKYFTPSKKHISCVILSHVLSMAVIKTLHFTKCIMQNGLHDYSIIAYKHDTYAAL